MKKLILIIVAIVLVVSTGYFIIKNSRNGQYKIVKLKGCEAYSNFSRSDFEWITGPDKDSISALPLFDGDMVYIFTGSDEIPFYRYKENDGDFLDFYLDDFLLFMNGNIVSIEFTEDEDLTEWLKEIDSKDIHDLRYISVTTYSPEVHLKYLKKIASIKPDIGLFVDNDISDIGDILDLFDITWMAAPECQFEDNTKKKIADEKSLELLYIGEDDWDLDILSKLPKLKALILIEIEQPEINEPLIKNDNLKSLTIIESGIRNISSLSNLTNLIELNILNCDSLTSINSIDKLSKLQRLSLINCGNLKDIDVLGKLNSIKWISFHPDVTEEELNYFIEHHKSVEAVELINCSNINDISPFKKLKKLDCFTYFDTDIDLNSVYDLKGLSYLSLPDSIYSDVLNIDQIREKNPNCVIVPNAGFCLGSGWLLLIIPALVISKLLLLLVSRYKK
jgi:hypothetical protein